MVVGMRNLADFNDCLRYSLSPFERMLLSSINRCNDSRRKCLDELVFETLHEGSMMAQEIVLTNNKTLTFNLSICKSFNADFDKQPCQKQEALKGCNLLVSNSDLRECGFQ